MFKSKAINAQGSRISIDDGTGTPIDDITGVSKAAEAVVLSLAADVAEGDTVRFIDVAGMPEINGLSGIVKTITPGVSFVVDIDTTGFAAVGTAGTASQLVYVEGCEVKTFNGFDGQAAEVDITTLCSEAREYLIGLQDFGAFSFDVNLVPNDPFQVECNEAKAARARRTFTLSLPPGTDGKEFMYVFDAFVRQFTIAGGVDQALTGSVALRVTGEPQLLELA